MGTEQSVWSVGKQRITAKTICVKPAANGRQWSGYIKGVEKPRREKPMSESRRRGGELSEGESVVQLTVVTRKGTRCLPIAVLGDLNGNVTTSNFDKSST